VLDELTTMQPGHSSDFECDVPNAEVEWAMTGGDDTKIRVGDHEAYGCSFATPSGRRVHCEAVRVVADDVRWEPGFKNCVPE
jgi:hypothetical protein